MTVLLHLHVARGCVGPPCLASVVEVGVAPSIRHLPPARGVRGVSHAEPPIPLPLVIQTRGSLSAAVRMEEVDTAFWGSGMEAEGGSPVFDGPSWMMK